MDRNTLELELEKATFKYLNLIKEHTQDAVHIYVNRNNIDIDRSLLQGVLDIVRACIEDGSLAKMGFYKEDLARILNEYTASTKSRK